MSDALTVGVEEEFLVVDVDGYPLPLADAVLTWLTTGTDTADQARFKHELQLVQVEAVSAVHTTMSGLAADLDQARAELAAAGRGCGVSVLPLGTSPTYYSLQEPQAAANRHARIHRRFAEMARGYTACGTHVHVGVDDPDRAVAVVNHLRPWLPTLIAVGANSPFHDGRDSGYSSWRIAEQARFPGAGLPPYARSADDYDDQVLRLVDCGVLVDSQMSFWLARPSRAYPTVEVRAADAAARVQDAVLQAALTRALVATALRKLDAGIEGPQIDHQVGAAAVWSAARHGLTGAAVDPIEGTRVPAVHLFTNLLSWIADDLDDAGDTALVAALVAALHTDGTGAARQRRAASQGLCDLIAAFRLTDGNDMVSVTGAAAASPAANGALR